MVRAVAMNALGISDPDPMPFSIKLDAGVHPVDLEVLALVLNAESITETNADSGAPQGTVVIDGRIYAATDISRDGLPPVGNQ